MDGLRQGDRTALSRAITLVESTRPAHQEKAHAVLDACLDATGNSERIAITGVPGVGKSTFIETLGLRLIEDGRRLAVLTVDPSSERSKGSILGDKTRMDRLAASENAYIRPSPTSGVLGGVGPATREAMLLCEAAGFDTIFVETVGVGQAETTVHSMVDVFLLLALPDAGDALQGIKRGIMERAHVIAVNKADTANPEQTIAEYEEALSLLSTDANDWSPDVLACSAQTGEGVEAVWEAVQAYLRHLRATGAFEQHRREQAQYWMRQSIEQQLRADFFGDERVQRRLQELEEKVTQGAISPFTAAEELLALYRSDRTDNAS